MTALEKKIELANAVAERHNTDKNYDVDICTVSNNVYVAFIDRKSYKLRFALYVTDAQKELYTVSVNYETRCFMNDEYVALITTKESATKKAEYKLTANAEHVDDLIKAVDTAYCLRAKADEKEKAKKKAQREKAKAKKESKTA